MQLASNPTANPPIKRMIPLRTRGIEGNGHAFARAERLCSMPHGRWKDRRPTGFGATLWIRRQDKAQVRAAARQLQLSLSAIKHIGHGDIEHRREPALRVVMAGVKALIDQPHRPAAGKARALSPFERQLRVKFVDRGQRLSMACHGRGDRLTDRDNFRFDPPKTADNRFAFRRAQIDRQTGPSARNLPSAPMCRRNSPADPQQVLASATDDAVLGVANLGGSASSILTAVGHQFSF